MMDDVPIVLIDAYSQIFRSFFAIRVLTNARGEAVNAAFVFTRLLLNIERNYPGRRGAMLFDCGKVAFRLKLEPNYKANRPPMPDALKSQIPLIKEIVAAFGWPMLQHEGYEADDLIGALVKAEPQSEFRIVTSDKDLSQLVNEHVRMLAPATGSCGFVERDAAGVREKFGVPPELMIDYLALLGDASDNIAGVNGIGAKGAAELLNTFGAAETWLDDHSRLDGSKFGKKLDGQYDLLRRNRELIRLRTDLPEEFRNQPELLKRDEPDWNRITEICLDNQFKSILKELPELPAAEPETKTEEPDLFSAIPPAAEPPKNETVPEQLELF